MVLVNAVSFTAASAGTGTFAFAIARSSFRTPAQAVAQGDLANGQLVSYHAQDFVQAPTQRAWGHGTYNAGTVTRDPNEEWSSLGSAGTGPLNFAVPPVVSFDALASDIVSSNGPTNVTAVTGQYYVNSFYPPGIPVGQVTTTGVISRPLSNFFATLAAAQAAFPNLNFASYSVTLADQVDWCVWQSCMYYIYNLPDMNPAFA